MDDISIPYVDEFLSISEGLEDKSSEPSRPRIVSFPKCTEGPVIMAVQELSLVTWKFVFF